MKNIFITYNPKSELEQVLAIRLHTLGIVNGLQIYLPDRTFHNKLNLETKKRIEECKYVICFSMSPLSKMVKDELLYAYKVIHDKSKIIVIYDKKKNIKGEIANKFSEFYFDTNSNYIEKIISDILRILYMLPSSRFL